ncbi:IspD/TarI family cytidylyltransferase [Cellulomonas sp. P5_C5]
MGGSGAVAVVLAGGMGSRMRGPLPKQLIELGGEPILLHTLRRFADPGTFTRVVVVANPSWRAEIEELATSATGARDRFLVVAGGSSRNASIWSAVRALDEPDQTRCLIHDGVRPLATGELFQRVLEALDVARSVVPVIDSIDPLFRVSGDDVLEVELRSTVLRGQSPQGFWLGDLRRGLASVGSPGIDSYATVYEVMRRAFGEFEIRTVPGERNNLKITEPVDHATAALILGDLREART